MYVTMHCVGFQEFYQVKESSDNRGFRKHQLGLQAESSVSMGLMIHIGLGYDENTEYGGLQRTTIVIFLSVSLTISSHEINVSILSGNRIGHGAVVRFQSCVRRCVALDEIHSKKI